MLIGKEAENTGFARRHRDKWQSNTGAEENRRCASNVHRMCTGNFQRVHSAKPAEDKQAKARLSY